MGKLVSKLNLYNINLKSIIGAVAILLLGLLAGSGIGLNIAPDGDITIETDYAIELSDEQVPTLVENAEGEIEELAAPTVESIDGKQAIDEEKLDFGRGEYHDISSPDAYKNAVLGKCIDLDGLYGAQCVDLFADFHYNYTGRWLSTNGTGAAYGLWDARDYNAGDDYVLITDATQLQPGDWVIFSGGQYGHVGMSLGYYNNGYVALLGENQGGSSCIGGGSSANIINMSLKTFRGAFRPKTYVKPDPAPEPEPQPEIPVSGCVQWHVEQGDTMSKIMLECENTVQYGEAMDAYAKTWYSLVVKPGQSVYDGWTSGTGYGLYYNDDIEHRVEE